MGLDMYLKKRTYVKNWKNAPVGERWEITVKQGGDTFTGIKPERICDVVEEVAYWRKANHIHRWFVDNVQHGTDDCQEAYVDLDQLKALLAVCKEVLTDHSKAAEVLPTQGGFFFGSTDYDDFYFRDIEYTVDVLQSVLAEPDGYGDFYYRSSW